MKSAEFIALSASTMTLTALGIDIMLPVFAELREHFGLSNESTAASQIIVFFFMGQVAQIFFGVLSDRFGRISILRIGFPLYIAGGIAAAFAPSLKLMFAARFLAGMGASAVFMTTIAGVRDRFVGDQMARTMSLIFTIFLFTPIFAPFLGLAILSVSNWQMVFLTPPLFAVIVFVWSLRLKESLPPEKRIPLHARSISSAFRKVITNRTFLRYTIVTTLLFSVLSSWVASSEHMVGEIYGRPDLFAWIFAGIGLVMSLCTLINSWLSTKLGAWRAIRILILLYVGVASLLLVLTLIYGDPPPAVVLFGSIMLLLSINIAIEPNSSSLALQPMGDMAGMASAVYGTIFFFAGSAIGSLISHYMVHHVWPIVTGFFVLGCVAAVLVFFDKRGAPKSKTEI